MRIADEACKELDRLVQRFMEIVQQVQDSEARRISQPAFIQHEPWEAYQSASSNLQSAAEQGMASASHAMSQAMSRAFACKVVAPRKWDGRHLLLLRTCKGEQHPPTSSRWWNRSSQKWARLKLRLRFVGLAGCGISISSSCPGWTRHLLKRVMSRVAIC